MIGVYELMKKRIKLVLITMLLIVLSGVYSVIDKNNSIYDTTIDNSEFIPWELTEGSELRQSFVVGEKTLDGVSMKMTASGNVQDTMIKFQLNDEAGKNLVEKEISLAELENGKFFEIEFEQLVDCLGKQYTICLEVVESNSEYQAVVYSTPDVWENTEFIFNDEKVDDTMVLRTITNRFDLETFVVTLCFVLYVVLFMRWLTKLFK